MPGRTVRLVGNAVRLFASPTPPDDPELAMILGDAGWKLEQISRGLHAQALPPGRRLLPFTHVRLESGRRGYLVLVISAAEVVCHDVRLF